MRTVAHISDLHFGHNDPLLADALKRRLNELRPNVLVISGDLVEHATDAEFEVARDYLSALPKPQIVVPGNHDLPFWNIFERGLVGLSRYRRYITRETEPTFVDEEIAIVGADSAHLYPVKGGKITELQLSDLVKVFSCFSDKLVRMLVTHHPFDLPEPANPHLLIGHSKRAVERLAPVVDILMAGHVHLSSTGSTSTRYKMKEHAMAFVQAGTAISDRNKGEANSFNVICTGVSEDCSKRVVVRRQSWDKESKKFVEAASSEYRLAEAGWTPFHKPQEDAASAQ